MPKPDPQYEALGASAAAISNPAVLNHYAQLLETWCNDIVAYLGDSDRARWETNDSGPDTEVDYWRRRMQRLTSITDQLKTRACKNVIGVLSAATKQPDDPLVDKGRITALLRQWRQIDVSITEAANESKDNCKYVPPFGSAR